MSSGVALSIVHPWDPWSQAVGGFDTCIDGILRTAPADWPIELIGLSADVRARPPGRWMTLDFDGRQVRYFAAHWAAAVGPARSLPLSLRFSAACRTRGVRASGKIVEYHRFESGLGVSAGGRQRRVYFFHNHPPEETRPTQNNIRWKYFRRLHRRLLGGRLRGASLVVAVDPRTPAWVESVEPRLRGDVISLRQWADPSVFHLVSAEERAARAARLRAELGLPAGAKHILLAGRLEPQKDPVLLVRAFAAAARPDAFLLIVGDGELSSAVDAEVRGLGLADRVRRMGRVNRRDLAALYHGSDVNVCCSAFESGPRTSFEALACGTPVVSFDVGQIGPILEGDGAVGILVKDREVASLAQALVDILARPFDPGLPSRCAWAVRDHVPEKSLAELLRRYREWLEPGGGETGTAALSAASSAAS